MQIFISRSKFAIFAVLSCSLLIALNSGHFDTHFASTDMRSLTQSIPAYPLWGSLNAAYAVTPERTVTATSLASAREKNSPSSVESDSLWNAMSAELNLDHRTNSSKVRSEIRKLLADQGKLYSILKAAGPYIYFIHKQTKDRGLPAELALIPVIESEFNPNDRSKKGATGLWQLMPGTAHELGIKVQSSYDGRRNVIASTKAALAYFNDLGNLFQGNWDLAIAAYNCGQMKVQRVQRRTGCEDYWDLPLPKETRDYVPKLFAVAAIIKNPEKYGIHLPRVHNKPYFTELKTKKSINLATVAKSSGVSIETLHKLNPDYNHGKALPTKGTYTLLVPKEKAPEVKANLGKSVVTIS